MQRRIFDQNRDVAVGNDFAGPRELERHTADGYPRTGLDQIGRTVADRRRGGQCDLTAGVEFERNRDPAVVEREPRTIGDQTGAGGGQNRRGGELEPHLVSVTRVLVRDVGDNERIARDQLRRDGALAGQTRLSGQPQRGEEDTGAVNVADVGVDLADLAGAGRRSAQSVGERDVGRIDQTGFWGEPVQNIGVVIGPRSLGGRVEADATIANKETTLDRIDRRDRDRFNPRADIRFDHIERRRRVLVRHRGERRQPRTLGQRPGQRRVLGTDLVIEQVLVVDRSL